MTTNLIDVQHSDVIMATSNFAENHPVGFQWVMKAKERGAKLIHVDPRFTRTSAAADLHVPIRSGTNIVFFGGLIKYAIDRDLWFKDYVVNFTNASSSARPVSSQAWLHSGGRDPAAAAARSSRTIASPLGNSNAPGATPTMGVAPLTPLRPLAAAIPAT